MRVLVCGSRTWTNREMLRRQLDRLVDQCTDNILAVIHGCAQGADLLAKEWATDVAGIYTVNVALMEFPANWRIHGKSAGFIRNQQMLTEGKPDLVLAFWDGKSRGTKHMIDLAKKAGVRVEIIQENMTDEDVKHLHRENT